MAANHEAAERHQTVLGARLYQQSYSSGSTVKDSPRSGSGLILHRAAAIPQGLAVEGGVRRRPPARSAASGAGLLRRGARPTQLPRLLIDAGSWRPGTAGFAAGRGACRARPRRRPERRKALGVSVGHRAKILPDAHKARHPGAMGIVTSAPETPAAALRPPLPAEPAAPPPAQARACRAVNRCRRPLRGLLARRRRRRRLQLA